MNDERVDDLLRELGEALAVEPSPAVAARVRTRIAGARPPRWTFQVRAGVTAGVVVAVTMLMILVRPDRSGLPSGASTSSTPVAQVRQDVPPTASVTTATSARASGARRAARARPPRGRVEAVVTVARRDPDVQVSPGVREAFEQLQAGVWSGRITAESLSATRLTIEPTLIEPAVLEVTPLIVETAFGDSESDDAASPLPTSSVLDHTRSVT